MRPGAALPHNGLLFFLRPPMPDEPSPTALPSTATELPGQGELRERIAGAAHMAVLTGAGVSAESGVPTFRDDKNSYWAQFNPQDMASEAGFRAHPRRVWQCMRTGARPWRQCSPMQATMRWRSGPCSTRAA